MKRIVQDFLDIEFEPTAYINPKRSWSFRKAILREIRLIADGRGDVAFQRQLYAVACHHLVNGRKRLGSYLESLADFIGSSIC